MYPNAINRVSTVYQQPGKTRSDFSNGVCTVCGSLILSILYIHVNNPALLRAFVSSCEAFVPSILVECKQEPDYEPTAK